MFSAPFTIRQPRRPLGLVTLGWPQFVALGLSLGAIATVLSIVFLPAYLHDAFEIFAVREYERALGFEYGRVKGFPDEPPDGWLGFVRVTPDGALHRAGIRGGDIAVKRYGRDDQDLPSGLKAVAQGRTVCFFVTNPEEYRKGEGRAACVEGMEKATINRN